MSLPFSPSCQVMVSRFSKIFTKVELAQCLASLIPSLFLSQATPGPEHHILPAPEAVEWAWTRDHARVNARQNVRLDDKQNANQNVRIYARKYVRIDAKQNMIECQIECQSIWHMPERMSEYIYIYICHVYFQMLCQKLTMSEQCVRVGITRNRVILYVFAALNLG